jgi:hypothetical protein
MSSARSAWTSWSHWTLRERLSAAAGVQGHVHEPWPRGRFRMDVRTGVEIRRSQVHAGRLVAADDGSPGRVSDWAAHQRAVVREECRASLA